MSVKNHTKIANFPTPLYLTPPLKGFPVELCVGVGSQETRMMVLSDGRKKLFQPSESNIILVSWDPCADAQFHGDPCSGGVKYTGVGKLPIFVWFLTDIAVYLGNGARQADGFSGTSTGSHGCRIGWYNCRWPWVTQPGFQGHCILRSRISQQRCVLGTKLLKNTNSKPYTVYRME